MSTDFFQRQADARRTTKWLVILFFLAVVGIVGTVVVATTAALHGTRSIQQLRIHPEVSLDTVGIPLGAGAFSLALIGTGSLVKLVQLRGGGTTVAESLGGRRLNHNTTDPLERRVVNIVEEMALASGVPVPPVYFLSEEQGINAFAAGYSPSDAVVAVTRGTAEQLTRDELQGVIAHEFSHILNGDMRLNIRLIGVLHGILLLGLLGRMLFNIASRGGGSRRSGKDGGLYLLFIGLALLIVGYLGTFFGNLIKAAVSRQREYLADASAVQFTRNPEGIAGALKRIGAAVFGSKLAHPKAAELSHMYFGQGVWEGFTGMMATHPSLEKRILALEPNWNGVFPSMPQIAAAITELENVAGFVGRVAQADEVPVEVVRHSPDQVGNPTEQHRGYAAQLIENIPTEILEAVREPYGARAVMFALLLDPKAEVRERQFAALTEHMPADVVEFTAKLAAPFANIDPRIRLPLVDLALPALRSMTKQQYADFSRAFSKLVEADEQIALLEWTLHRVLLRHLRPQFESAKPARVAYYNLARLGKEIGVLLSTLAYLDNQGDRVKLSHRRGAELVPEAKVVLLPQAECSLAALQAALEILATVAPKQRQRVVAAAAELICYDRDVSIREAELYRGICDMLDCPMPPLLSGQPVE